MKTSVANHPFNRKCKVFYPNSIWIANRNFQKSEIYCKETFNR